MHLQADRTRCSPVIIHYGYFLAAGEQQGLALQPYAARPRRPKSAALVDDERSEVVYRCGAVSRSGYQLGADREGPFAYVRACFRARKWVPEGG